MFKMILASNPKKLNEQGINIESFNDLLKNMCIEMGFKELLPNHYYLEDKYDEIDKMVELEIKFKRLGYIEPNLLKWITYSDEDGEIDELNYDYKQQSQINDNKDKLQYQKLKENLYFLRDHKLRQMAMGRNVTYNDVESFLLGLCYMLYNLDEVPPNPYEFRKENFNTWLNEEDRIQALLDFWGVIKTEDDK